MRFDKVTLRGFLGFKKVYTVVIDKEGIYFIYTGKPGGLPNSFSHHNVAMGGAGIPRKVGASLGSQLSSPIIKKFQEEIKANEEKISKKKYLENKGSFFTSFKEIKEVALNRKDVKIRAKKKINLTFLEEKTAKRFTKIVKGN